MGLLVSGLSEFSVFEYLVTIDHARDIAVLIAQIMTEYGGQMQQGKKYDCIVRNLMQCKIADAEQERYVLQKQHATQNYDDKEKEEH
jgi:hypothetical protein